MKREEKSLKMTW